VWKNHNFKGKKMRFLFAILLTFFITGCGSEDDSGPKAVCIVGTCNDNRCWSEITEQRCIDEANGAGYEWSADETCKKAEWSWALKGSRGDGLCGTYGM
jgi:hypothetical protein